MAEFPRGLAVREQVLRPDSRRKQQSDIKTVQKQNEIFRNVHTVSVRKGAPSA
jgi:hypothetical protein